MAFVAVVGTAQKEFHVEDVDACASGVVVTNNGDQILSVMARSVAAAQEDMLLIVNALR
jgi:hypothetical protein